jgi:acetyl-CoA acyltransferase 1
MGWTSEMLALEYSVSREKQDEYGLLSHNRASAAQQAGKFDGEIIKVETSVLSDPKDSNSGRNLVVADKDDGIRHGQTLEKMRAGKPAFKDYGDARSTGANSSQVTDGGAMVIMMPRWKADELGLEVLAKHVATSFVGVAPRVMGIGPVVAIP